MSICDLDEHGNKYGRIYNMLLMLVNLNGEEKEKQISKVGGKTRGEKMQHVWCKTKYLYELLRAMNGKSLQNIDDSYFRGGGESGVFLFL